ncbi:MAG: hypothetical protein KF878_23990 [Planctomycetes bacterium]|nr:hypothetical protein [Planctomycetota bacterium]
MSEASREGVRPAVAALRCPFCHEHVRAEDERWVACAQCLARHHDACWGESTACGACGHAASLAPAEARASGRDLGPVPRGPDETDHIRRQTAALLEQEAARDRAWSDAFLGPLTLGVVPMLRQERALAAHHAANVATEEPRPDLEPTVRARYEEALHARVDSPLRVTLPIVGIAIGIFFVVWSRVQISGLDEGLPWLEFLQQLQTLQRFFLGGMATALLAFSAYMHAAREAVRSHERRQLFLRLVGGAVPKERVEKLVARFAGDWTKRRALDLLLTLLSLIPLVGLLLVPLIAARYSGSLALHERHEQDLDEVAPRRERPRKNEAGL